MNDRVPIDELRFQAIRDQFNQPVSPLGILALTVGLVGLIVVLLAVQRRELRQRRRRSPQAEHHHAFARVLRQLPLSFLQRRRVRRMARDLQLRMPVAILLSPAHFQAAIERWTRSCGGAVVHRERWEPIQRTLFADSDVDPPPGG